MNQLSPDPSPRTLQVLVACLLAFAIFITPISAIAAPSIARASVAKAKRTDRTDKTNKPKSAAEELFVNPPVAPATEPATETGAALPGPKPEPAPEPFAAPIVGAVTATMTAALTATANNVDGKADPGDTINYTVQLGNTTAADATGLSFNPTLDSHTTFVPGSIKSTPICFDQSVSTNEDTAKGITLTGQDPDGDTISFSIVTPPTHGGFGITTAPNLTYTPAADYNGPDSFVFRVNDGTTSGAGNNGNSNETCTVSITVNSVNDAPTFTVPGNPTAVNEDAGAQSVSSFITGVRPAQVGNTTEDTQTVSFVITNNTNPGIFSSAPALNVVGASYPKTATLTYTPAANQNGTATITYHAHDNGGTANSGVDNSADQTFTITVNAVNDPPVVPTPAAFAAQANMKRTGLGGLLTGVTDVDTGTGSPACNPTPFTIKAGSISATTPAGGTISNVDLNAGTFDFDPPPGVTGVVTFTYVVKDNGCPGTADSAPVTVTFNVSGPVIWFVDTTLIPAGNGTLSTPFNNLDAVTNAATGKLGLNPNQRVFVFGGSTTAVGTTTTLQGNNTQATQALAQVQAQWLIGQGVLAASFDTFFGITPPAGTIARPAINGTRPTIRGTVTMKENTVVQGLNIDVSAGGSKGLTASSLTAGTSGSVLTIKDVNVTSAGGSAVDFNSAQTVTYSGLDGTVASVRLTDPGSGYTSPPTVTLTGGGGSGATATAVGPGSVKAINITNAGTSYTSVPTMTLTGGAGSGATVTALMGVRTASINSGGGGYNLGALATFSGGGGSGATARVSVSGGAVNGIFIETAGSGYTSFPTITITPPSGGGGSGATASVTSLLVSGGRITNAGSGYTSAPAVGFSGGGGSGAAATSTLETTVTGINVTSAGSGYTSAPTVGFSGGSGSGATASTTLAGSCSITSAGGIALNVLNTTISASGLTFRSISANGGPNGIVLSNTGASGGLTVTGSTGTCISANTAGCSGGTIQNTTGADNSSATPVGTGIVLNTTINVSLTRMFIHDHSNYGIRGTSVTGFILDNSVINGTNGSDNPTSAGSPFNEGSFKFDNLTGPAFVSNTILSGGIQTNVRVDNTSATLNRITFLNDTIGTNSVVNGDDGMLLESETTGTIKATILNTTFTFAAGDLFNFVDNATSGATADDLIFNNNTLTNSHPAIATGGGGTTISSNGTKDFTFHVQGNTFRDAIGGNILLVKSTGAASYSGTFTGNSVGVAAVRNSGSAEGSALKIQSAGQGTVTVAITNNQFHQFNNNGIELLTGGGASAQSGTFNATITGNLVDTPGDDSGTIGLPKNGIHLNGGTVPGDTYSICTQIGGAGVLANSIATGGKDAVPPTLGDIDFRLRQRQSTTVRLPGYGGGNTDDAAVLTFVAGNNGGNGAPAGLVSHNSPPGGGYVGGAACTSPTTMYRPDNPNQQYYLARADELFKDHRNDSLISFLDTKEPLISIFENFDSAKQSAQALLARDRAPQSLVIAETAIASESKDSNTAASLPQWLGQARNSVAQFGNGVDSLIVPTAHAEKAEQKTGVRSQESGVRSQRSVIRVQKSDVRANHAKKPDVRAQRSEARGHSATSRGSFAPMPFSGGTFPINGTGSGFSLPIGKTITIKFSVTLNNPPNLSGVPPATPQVSAQGTLSGAFIGNPIVTDDPGTVAANDATVTLVDLFDTTTTLGAVPAAGSWNVGQSVTFTATVASNPTGNPTAVTGSVIFKDNGTAISGCNGVALSSAQAQCVTSFGSGAHSVTAVYSGDGNFDPSTSSALSQGSVSASGTSTAVTSSLNPSLVTQNVTFTATVTSTSGFAGPPTGTVTFKDGVNPITCSNVGGQALNGSGVATCQIATLPAGSHSITAVYPGDTNFTTSTGTLTGDPQVVNKSDTTTLLTSSSNPVAPTVQVTYTATVSSSTSVAGPPSGTVTFKDGVTTIVCEAGSQALTAGVATCKFTYPDAVGSPHDITAVYGGDTTFNGNTSNHVSEVIQSCSASVVVTSNADSGANTLRDAINNGVCAGGTITFDPSVTSITLTTGELAISKNMTITGPGAATLTISGNNASRVFNVASGKTATISGMTITAGKVLGANGAAGSAGIDAKGGAVINAGTLTLSNVILSGSHATGGDGGSNTGAGAGGVGGNGLGGGIYNSGTLTLTNTTVNGSNSATGGKGGDTDAANTNGNGGAGFGGGVYSSGTLTLTNSTISGNSVVAGAPGTGGTGGVSGSASGGGVYNDATAGPAGATITGSTISGNTAGQNGGGIFNVGAGTNATLTITNSTISGNGANNDGGGIYNAGATGTTTLTSVTVTGNTTDKDDLGGGAGGGLNIASGTFTLKNTIVAGNLKGTTTPTAHDITGTINTAASASSYNLIGDAASSGGLTDGTDHNIVGNAGVGTIDIATVLNTTLADNGGPTKTHALVTGSPALEKGNAFSLTTDQRGFPRPVNSDGAAPIPPFDDTDIGAFEKQLAPNAPGAPDLDAVSDSGANNADDKTNVTTNLSFTIPGVLSGATVQLFRDGSPVASGVASGITIQLTDPGPLTFTASGTTYSYTAKQSFGADTSVASTALPVLITIVPDAPVLDPASDSGTLGDGITNDTSPTFNITNVVNTATVKLFRDGVEVASGTAAGTTIQLTDPSVPNGTFTYTAKQIFNAITSDPSAGTSITITIKPSAPDLDAASDSGVSNTDNYTNDATPTFTIAGVINGANVELLRDGTSVANGTAVGTSIQLTDPGASDGLHTYKARQTVGITLSPDSDGLDVTIDTSIAQPSTPDLITADDSNINNDNVTSKTTPTFTGTAEANSSVQLFATGVLKGTGTADNAGAWSITSIALADGPYNITVVATDLAGNVSVASAALPIVIDTTKPTVAMSSAVGNPTATTPIPVTVTFSESVTGFTIGDIVPGNGTVGNFAGGPAIYTFDLTPTSPGPVSADIAGGAAIDLAGNTNTAATQFNRTFDPSALSVTITPVAPDPRNTSVSSIQIVFNKAVTGFDLPDLTLKLNGGANLLTGAQTLTSGDNITWTLGNLSGLTGTAGTYVLKLTASGSNIKDAANNPLTSDATESWVTDTTAPDVTINQAVTQIDPVTGPTASTVINFTAIFSEPVLAGSFTNTDVTISGTAGATVVNITEIAPNDGTHFNVAVEGMTQSGTVIANIPAGAAQDAAGNGNTVATFTDNTVTFFKDDFTTFEVNTTLDADDGACTPLGTGNGCTLREAINAANNDAGAETITFNATVFAAPGPYTINLGSVLPDITSDMTINGPGANVLTVKRNVAAQFRIFSVTNNATVSISGLTVANGNTNEGGGLKVSPGTLTLTRVAVSGNTANNLNGGGGIVVDGSSTLNVIESTISGNHATVASGVGGGIFNNGGTLSIVNSTISGNDVTQGQGGGIFGTGAGSTTLSSSTITGNTAQSGGGIRVTGGHPATLKNTIIGGNTGTVAGPDMSNGGSSGTFSSAGFNLIKSTSDATINETLNPGTNITGQDPQLFPLADNGGPTKTHALQCTSPAIDKGKAFTLTTDQRGGVRPFDLADAIYPNAAGGDGSDIGAVEVQTGGGCQPVAVPPNPQPSTNEDTQVTITLKGTYSQNFPLTFTITQSPAHGSLGSVSAPVCNFNLSETCTATVNYTPALNFNGLDSFKFKVSAGGLDSDEADVNVTVIPVNDPPVANGDALSSIAEDSGVRTIPFADLLANDSPGPADEAGQTLTVISVSNPVGGTVSILGTNVLFTPTANYFGPASFQYKIRDNGTTNGAPDPKDSVLAATVTFTIDPVADTPSVTNATTNEDTQTTSGLVISRNPADGAEVTNFKITSIANGTLFQHDGTTPINNGDFITFAQGNAGLKFTPNANLFSPTTTFSFQVQASLNNTDAGLGGGLATATITVNPVADTPSVTNATTLEDTQTTSGLVITRNPADGAEVTHFKITGITGGTLFQSNGTTPINNGDFITFAQGNAGLKFTPTPDSNANGGFQVQASLNNTDAGLGGGLATATITVIPVNDAPSFTKGPDQTVNEDAGAQTVAGWATSLSVGPANEAGQTLTFLVTGNTNPGLFSAGPDISPTGTLTYTPATNINGSALITIVLKDSGGTANGGVDTSAPQTFTITVNSVNDAPSFTKGADQIVNEDAGAQSVANWATSISAGPPNESGQTLTFQVTGNTNPGLFSAGPAISPTGTLTYTSAPDANGSASITIVLKDNGGTANGGQDTSAPQTFTITVNAVNDAPVNHVPGAQNIPLNALFVFSVGTGNAISISDVDAGSDPVQVTLKATDGTITLNGTAGLSFTVGDGTDDPLMTFTGSIANINAALDGMKNLTFGSGVITITTNDLGHNGIGGPLSATDTIQVTVIDNLAPVLLTIPGTDRAIAFDSTSFVIDPFNLQGNSNFIADHRTHIMLFALHAQLRPGETASAITAEADVDGTVVPLIVESVMTVPNFDWLTQLVVKFPDGFSTGGGGPHDAKIRIRLRGQNSNQAVIIIVPAPRP